MKLVNESLELIDCSPLKKYVQTGRILSFGKRKINKVTNKFSNAVPVALTGPGLADEDGDNCTKLVHAIKEKLRTSNREKAVQILTIVPEDWSIQKPVDFFDVTEYYVKAGKKVESRKRNFGNPR